jgi:predicted phage-related endonuclease
MSVVVGIAGHSESDTVALDEVAPIVDLLRQVKAKQDKLSAVRTSLERALKDVMGRAQVGTLAGRPAVTWKTSLRITVVQSQLKERYPQVALDCQDITEVRTFKVLDS